MVFANTVEAVEVVAQVLHGKGIECYCYHSESSLEERTRNLIDFKEKGGVFVCTDAAPRGTEIPNVSHVIQAEFATSAVDFLHRIRVLLIRPLVEPTNIIKYHPRQQYSWRDLVSKVSIWAPVVARCRMNLT
ncbi:unnamed protein product [Lactuca virosa]|uniref:Helicase C-terminal domain-containing protein n=1 Tax=Lactuca virosa TaxID=75947 RepID=A0AAU9MAC0_9ASTR|nr:unnamed protein product [Lactuca virosa]